MSKKLHSHVLSFLIFTILAISFIYARSTQATNAYKIAMGDLKNGHYKMAIEGFKRALKLDPKYIDARFGLGVAYLQSGNLDEAIKNLNMVNQVRKSHAPTLFWLAVAYQKKGDIKKAIKLYEKCLSKDINFPEAYFQLGNIAFEKGDTKKAIKYYKEAIKTDKRFTKAYFNIALIYYKQNKKELAIKTLQEGLKVKSDDIELLYFLGYITAFNKSLRANIYLNKDALQYFLQVIQYSKEENKKINKDNLYLLLSKLFIAYIKYQFKDCYKIANEIINKYKDIEEPYIVLTMIKLLEENKNEALKYLNRGLKINPDNKVLKRLKSIYF